MKLYEIDAQIDALIDEETGEIVDVEEFEKLQIAREEKIENIALLIKNIKADAEAYAKEEASFKAKKDSANKKIANLKEFLMQALNGTKLKTLKVNCYYNHSKSVDVLDINKVDSKYYKYKEPEVDKTLVKEAILSGIDVEGCELKESTSLVIR